MSFKQKTVYVYTCDRCNQYNEYSGGDKIKFSEVKFLNYISPSEARVMNLCEGCTESLAKWAGKLNA